MCWRRGRDRAGAGRWGDPRPRAAGNAHAKNTGGDRPRFRNPPSSLGRRTICSDAAQPDGTLQRTPGAGRPFTMRRRGRTIPIPSAKAGDLMARRQVLPARRRSPLDSRRTGLHIQHLLRGRAGHRIERRTDCASKLRAADCNRRYFSVGELTTRKRSY
jgi:hypothetical protein